MDTTPCGRFELTFKFKLFTVGGSVSGPHQFLIFFIWQFSHSRHLFVRALPSSSIRTHCTPFAACDTRAEGRFLVEVRLSCRSVQISLGMVVTQSSSCHPSSTRSSMLSLNISEFFGRGGGLDVITSYHHFRVKELFPDNVIFLLNSFSREGQRWPQ